MNEKNLETKNENTWCPGCTNFFVKNIVVKSLAELSYKKEEYCLVSDIGCNSKIYDYINLSGINGLHGRTIPTAFGVKLGNPNLKVIGFMGDGGCYAEGIEHFIHACRTNAKFTLLVMNNEVFALTVGQPTPTTELEFRDKSTPDGVKEKPLNPIALALVAGATFVARMNVFDIENSKQILKQAIEHKGFSFIDVIQPCVKFHNISDIIRQKAYKVNPASFEDALKLAEEHLGHKARIPYGIFYRNEKQTFEEKREVLAKLLKEKKGFAEIRKQRDVLGDFLK
jgi:2-oxoglutarate ferredoxin oxidoreductase subunit beta